MTLICGVASYPVRLLTEKVRGKSRLTYRQGEPIFVQDEPANSVFYIEHGNVKKSYVSRDGKESAIAVLGVGDFFGTACVIGRPKRSTTATAMTACTVMRLERGMMLHLLASEPAVAEMFIAFLIDSRGQFQADLIDQLTNPGEKRLARTLLALCDMGNEHGGEVVLPKISQETLGQLVGTTRTRVNHFMRKFRERGLIEFDGRIRVRCSQLNSFLGEDTQ